MDSASIAYLAHDLSARGDDLLTAEEEAALGRVIRSIDSTPEERERAIGTLVEKNLRLLVHVARKHKHPGEDVGDAIGDGFYGLRRAAMKFDPEMGIKFSTYASIWIKQTMVRGRGDSGYGRPFRVPNHVHGKANRSKRLQVERRQAGEEITLAEAARRLGFGSDAPFLGRIDAFAFQEAEPIDGPETSPSDHRTPIDQYADAGRDEDTEIDRPNIVYMIRLHLKRLPPRDRQVVRWYYGLDELPGGGKATFKAIGDVLGLTRERIRQIHNVAALKLRKWAEEAGCS